MLPFSAVVQTAWLRSAGTSAAPGSATENTVNSKSAASVFLGSSPAVQSTEALSP